MYESYINKIEDVGNLRNLKPGTIRTYKNNVTQFLEFIQKNPEDLTSEAIISKDFHCLFFSSSMIWASSGSTTSRGSLPV